MSVTRRYHAVVNVRRHAERKVAASLADARNQVERLRAERDALATTPQETGTHSAAEAVLAHLAHERTEQARKALDDQLGQAQRCATEVEQSLVAAHQSLRLVEILQERAHELRRRDLEKREAKALEDAARRR